MLNQKKSLEKGNEKEQEDKNVSDVKKDLNNSFMKKSISTNSLSSNKTEIDVWLEHFELICCTNGV